MRKANWSVLLWVVLLWAVLMLPGCATGGDKRSELEQRQYDYSAAIRWGDFEGAWSLIDPEVREKHPKTALEFERYKQIQVSGYTDLAAEVTADKMHARREIQIGVVNKHTMTERSLRYTEVWRFDPATKTWWITSGLPDFWAGM